MRVRKAVFPAAGWGTRFLPATKAQPKEMLPLVDKPIIQYAVEEAVAAGIEQVIIVTSSQKRAIEDHFDLSYELEHLLEEKGDIEMLRQVRRDQRPRPGRLRPPEGAARPRPRGADGQGPDRPRAVRGDPARRRRRRRPAVHRPADPRLPPDPRARSSRSWRSRPRRPAATASSAREPTEDPLDHGRLHRVTQLVEKPAAGRRAVEPGDHRPLRADAQDLRQARADPARRRRRDPADRRDRGPDGGAGRSSATSSRAPATTPGTTMGWLKASVELALARPDLGAEFRAYLQGLEL